ncbi:MAG: response regulator transcription factor [Bacteroidetes bacterium]|nr:response regulator transcription factor [Bacteroidota bacterium]
MDDIRVAIVEDTDLIRKSLIDIVNHAFGFKLIAAYENAEDAVDNLTTQNVDVVLMDINLPGMNGIECIQKLVKLNYKTQYLMCTVYEDDEKVFDALQAGAHGYILKKTPPQELLEAISQLHAGGSPMSSQIARKVVGSFSQPKKTKSGNTEMLTDREHEILDLLAKGYRYKEIAEKSFISIETVRRHVHNIYQKLHVNTRTEALNKVNKFFFF